MIITCPDCATRYDVDDERFSPNGRSVRCSSCGESWFVPAPEMIDVAPMEENAPRRGLSGEKADRDRNDLSAKPKMKVGIADPEEGRYRDRSNNRASRYDDREESYRDRNDRDQRRNRKDARSFDLDEHGNDLDDEDSLFDSPSTHNERNRDKAGRDRHRDDALDESRNKKDHGGTEKSWRKGRQFIVEDNEDETEHRPFFARKSKNKEDVRRDHKDDESLRFADEDDDEGENDRDLRDRDAEQYNNAHIVDADWEDVADKDSEYGRGFGRKVRAERRRATALARMEDVRPLDPEALDEEFFAALKVTPRELERAIRKARRRAEAREKNRLTPLRVFGWTAWAAIVAGSAYGIFIYRDEIVKMAPKTADAYAVIGIDANPYGLSIENVRHRLAMSTGGATIEITGNLRNETDASVAAPLLQAEALGPRGELLARWTFTANQSDVSQGEMVDFITRAPAPEGVAEVALSFAPSGGSVLKSLIPKDAD